MSPLTNADRFAHFTIAEFLGSDSARHSYRAIDVTSRVSVHLTILHTDTDTDDDRRRYFRTINEALRRGDVPSAPRILDIGDCDGQLWVATEHLTGVNAEYLLQQRFPSGMPYESAILIAYRIAECLDEAHRLGVPHGDVTPANIHITGPFSTNYRVKLIGFGERFITGSTSSAFYTAPETLSGGPPTDRSDQFSLAATAFRLVTGRTAFDDDNRTVTSAGSLRFRAAALDNPGIAVDGLEDVFERAFSFDPAGRYPSCTDLVADLNAPPRTRLPPISQPRSTDARAPRRLKRSILVSAAAALVVVSGVTAIGVTFSGSEAEPEAAPVESLQSVVNSAPPLPACRELDAITAALTVRQKLAQTLMVGVTDIDDARRVVSDHQVGGIFIGSWTDLTMLSSGALRELQSAPRTIPLAVSVDEEGGRVQRLKSLIGSQVSPRQLVTDGTSLQQVHDIAFERGRKMREYGITVDFAPVVDVTDAAPDTVIGDRSFSDDPEVVIRYAGAYAQGLRDAGLLPVLKHFPGHGRASGDSHLNGVTTPPLDDLVQSDLVPYRTLVAQLPVAVMLGHLQVPGLTGDAPASLSPEAYSLLRQGDYGGPAFAGPTFTDDLSSMGAINQRYSVPEAVLKALQAGADTALWISTGQVPAVLDTLENAVNEGRLPMSRVDDAVRLMAMTKNTALTCPR